MSGWDFESTSSERTVEFTKFAEGVTDIRVVDDVPNIRWTHWMPQFKRSVNCPGKGCPICEIRSQQKANKMDYTYSMSRRFSLQIINRNTGKLEIMEQGVTFFEDLKDVREMLMEEGKTFADADLRVRRRGSGKDNTSYRIDIGDYAPLSESDKKLIEDKIDLDEYFKPTTPEQITRLINGEEWDKVMYEDNEDNEEEFSLK